MTTVELERAAAAILPPVGAGALCLVTDEQQRHRVAFVINGRGKAPVGPGFAKPRDAARFMDLLAGERPAPRPGQTTVRQDPPPGPDIASDDAASAGTPSSSSAGPTGAPGAPPTSGPDVAGQFLGSAAVPPVMCAGCGEGLPPGSRRDRRTHDAACRQAALRRRRGIDTGTPDITPSRAVSTDPPQGEAVGVSSSARRLLRGAANPASRVSRARVVASQGSGATG